jgi:hypothetical protein
MNRAPVNEEIRQRMRDYYARLDAITAGPAGAPWLAGAIRDWGAAACVAALAAGLLYLAL